MYALLAPGLGQISGFWWKHTSDAFNKEIWVTHNLKTDKRVSSKERLYGRRNQAKARTINDHATWLGKA